MVIDVLPSEAMSSPLLFEPFFRGPSWDRWHSVIKGAFGKKLTEAEERLFREVAERAPPTKRVGELACIVGRGGGKDAVASLLAVTNAINYKPDRLRPGERAVVMTIACDREQAKIAFQYIRGYFEQVEPLNALVTHIGRDSVSLRNGVDIEVYANDFRSVRGRSLLCIIMDECAFYCDDNFASPDSEVYAAVGPGIARVPGSMLIMISSAYKRSGLLYKKWQQHYGKDDDETLVVRGSTLLFNPSFDAKVIERDLANDRERYGAEYLSEWRDDLSSFISRELLEAATDRGVIVRPPMDGVDYIAGCDPSGGRGDSFTMAVAHRDPDGWLFWMPCTSIGRHLIRAKLSSRLSN
jgi:hypothetical protein